MIFIMRFNLSILNYDALFSYEKLESAYMKQITWIETTKKRKVFFLKILFLYLIDFDESILSSFYESLENDFDLMIWIWMSFILIFWDL